MQGDTWARPFLRTVAGMDLSNDGDDAIKAWLVRKLALLLQQG